MHFAAALERRAARARPTTIARKVASEGPTGGFARESASGKILYEEYHPYGTSAYRASNGSVDVSARRYRYTGKERDEETGLYYNGARYLAAWLGRWTSADPIGIGADGPGLYNYTRGSPVDYADPSGAQSSPWDLQDGVSGSGAGDDQARLELEYAEGAECIPIEPELPEPDHPFGALGSSLSDASDQGFRAAAASNNGLEKASGYLVGSFMWTMDLVAGPLLNAPNRFETSGQYVGRATLQEDPLDAVMDLRSAMIESELGTVGVASVLAPELSLETRALTAEVQTGRGAMRGPLAPAEVISPPRPGQVLLGGTDNAAGTYVLEGHGSQVPGTFTVPDGTWLRMPDSVTLSEEAGRYAGAHGRLPADVPQIVFGPGRQAPNHVLFPPTRPARGIGADDVLAGEFDEMFVREGSTTVTRPTLLSDILQEDMGFCVWAACRRPWQ